MSDGEWSVTTYGPSLRNRFEMAALTGLCVGTDLVAAEAAGEHPDYEKAARFCRKAADALLAARDGKGEQEDELATLKGTNVRLNHEYHEAISQRDVLENERDLARGGLKASRKECSEANRRADKAEQERDNLLKALRHAKHRDHSHAPRGCDGCREIDHALATAEKGGGE